MPFFAEMPPLPLQEGTDLIDPHEIAELAWFLASPAASSISGQSVGVAGILKHFGSGL